MYYLCLTAVTLSDTLYQIICDSSLSVCKTMPLDLQSCHASTTNLQNQLGWQTLSTQMHRHLLLGVFKSTLNQHPYLFVKPFYSDIFSSFLLHMYSLIHLHPPFKVGMKMGIGIMSILSMEVQSGTISRVSLRPCLIMMYSREPAMRNSQII